MAKKKSSPAPISRMRREAAALALIAFTLVTALPLVPVAHMGAFGEMISTGGNIFGPAGRLIAAVTWGLFGVTGVLLPLLPAIWAAYLLSGMERVQTIRATTLLVGLLLLVPSVIFAFVYADQPAAPGAGLLGSTLGAVLAAIFGWFGAGLLVLFALAVLFVLTLGWNPLRTLVRGGRSALDGARRGVTAGAAMIPKVKGEGPSRELAVEGIGQPENSSPWAALDTPAEIVSNAPALTAGSATALDTPAEVLPETPLPALSAPSERAASAPRRSEDPLGVDSGDPDATDLPLSDLLDPPAPVNEAKNRQALDGLGSALVEKLATFRIDSELIGMTVGPVVTQFEVSPAPGIKVARIANLEADLALALRAPSVRIVAPIPGKGAVGVEVPNPEPQIVNFREVLESPAFRASRAQLPLALGKDIAGKPYVADLARMPHLLIAGATGSGKSVCVNTIVTSLIYRHTPRSLRLLMVDPKMVELSMYNDLPHLRHPVVTDNSEAAGVLKWAVLEMERRYELLSHNGVRNLQDFNQRVESGTVMRTPNPEGEEGDPDRWIYQDGPLPYIVLIIDELADLMMTVQGEVEKPLALLAQKARAIGIHLILATQRPSVNVLTGLIKANFPSRIGFRVSSKVDSRTILDQNGADMLLGNGDMLFLPPGQSDPLRIQGAYLSTEETERLMDWYREQAAERRARAELEGQQVDVISDEVDILEVVRASEASDEQLEMAEAEDRDKLFRDAAELCIQHQGGSTSLLQRRLRIGYGRAARIIDQLHSAGILGPPDGSKPREVLVDIIQLDQIFPEG